MEASVLGSFRVVRLHCTVVIVAEVTIINRGVVCIHRASQGWLLLVGRILRAGSPQMLFQFIRVGVDRARHLAVASELFIA
jgi:hypothetical protein